MRHTILMLFILFGAYAHAQTTGNKYVAATVENGLVTISKKPNINLTYAAKSFVSIMVDGIVFTNNTTGVNIASASNFGGFLGSGVSQKISDTVRTTWENVGGCEIIQNVFPKEFEVSGQIIINWSIQNKGSKAVKTAVQYLADITIGKAVATTYGYNDTWVKYENYFFQDTSSIPSFFATFQKTLPVTYPDFEPGNIITSGHIRDPFSKFGPYEPKMMVFGDWGGPLGTALVDMLWGPAASSPWNMPYQDLAVLYQWNVFDIEGKGAKTVAQVSYGTPEFGFCNGQLAGVMFYPRRFSRNQSLNTGKIITYLYDVYSPNANDPYFGPSSSNTYLKLHLGPNLKILAPDTSVSLNKKSQRQQVFKDGYIAQRGAGCAIWTIVADKQCDGNVDSWLKFTAESSLSSPIFFNSGDADTCEHAVVIECEIQDTAAPIADNLNTITSYPYQKIFDIHDDRINDTGIDSISWEVSPGSDTDPLKFKIELPAFAPCSKTKHTVRVIQLDSSEPGCFDFRIKDCSNNSTLQTVCLPRIIVDPMPDTNAPVITIIGSYPGDTTPCRNLCDTIRITDNQEFDVGLESITMLASSNMTISVIPIKPGDSSHTTVICVVDSTIDGSLTIRAQDTVGNFSEMIFCYKALQAGIIQSAGIDLMELIGNPASERTSLRINVSASHAATIRVVDLTGREVHSQQARLLAGRNDLVIGTSGLAEGIYYVIADWDGRSYAKKLTVIK